MDGTMTQASLSTFMQREVNSCSGARILIKTVSAARRLPPHTYAPPRTLKTRILADCVCQAAPWGAAASRPTKGANKAKFRKQ
jgi:hypothetical protein